MDEIHSELIRQVRSVPWKCRPRDPAAEAQTRNLEANFQRFCERSVEASESLERDTESVRSSISLAVAITGFSQKLMRHRARAHPYQIYWVVMADWGQKHGTVGLRFPGRRP